MTPKNASSLEDDSLASLTFNKLTVSLLEYVVRVEFHSKSFGRKTLSELRQDFLQLSEALALNSKVLFDFAGVESFCDASINALELFNRDLRTKGSRIALCRLAPGVKQSFFAWSNGHEKRK